MKHLFSAAPDTDVAWERAGEKCFFVGRDGEAEDLFAVAKRDMLTDSDCVPDIDGAIASGVVELLIAVPVLVIFFKEATTDLVYAKTVELLCHSVGVEVETPLNQRHLDNSNHLTDASLVARARLHSIAREPPVQQ